MNFSVIIPAYNCEATLRCTVESILRSGLDEYEILLIDDGSTDGTPMLCNQLSAEHSIIRCTHQSNGGVSAARNRGIQEARGDYLLFFDSDDTVDAGAFAQIVGILGKYEPDMLLFGMSFDYYYHGKLYRRDSMGCSVVGGFERKDWLPLLTRLYECNYLSPVWNKLIRRKLILDHQIRFSERMHLMEDCLFTMQCLEHSNQIYLLSEAIYRYRQPEDEGNVARRLKRISSLVDYMEAFSVLPEEWRNLVDSIYYMLLHQKVRSSNTKEIAEIALDHKRATFAPQTERDQWLCDQLAYGNYQSLYLRNLKSNARHKAAVFAKSHGLYQRK